MWPVKANSFLPLIAAFSLLSLATTGCGGPFRMNGSSGARIQTQGEYKYQDPRSGDEVPARLADQRPSTVSAPGFNRVQITHTTVQIKNEVITVNLDKLVVNDGGPSSANDQPEHFRLTGPLDKNLSAQLVDTNPVHGKSRMKAYAECVGLETSGTKNCSEVYVNLYFYLDGERTERQFTVKNFEAHAQAVINESAKPKEPTSPANGATTVGTPAPPTAAELHDDEDTSVEENFIESSNSRYRVPKPDEKFWDDVQPDATVKKPREDDTPPSSSVEKPAQTKTKPAPTTNQNTNVGPSLVEDDGRGNKIFSDLMLTGGGRSFKLAFEGLILDGPGTQIPRQSEGLRRVSSDLKAYGTGYSVSYLESAARDFANSHKECGPIVVRNASKANGGVLMFDHPEGGKTHSASHQNGLDFDIAYLTLPDTLSVVSGGKTTKDFVTQCNYEWIKYVACSDLPSHDDIANVLFVHTAIYKTLCRYKNTNRLNSPCDQRLAALLSPTSDGHGDHMHLRLNCSPEHAGCEDRFPNTPNCE